MKKQLLFRSNKAFLASDRRGTEYYFTFFLGGTHEEKIVLFAYLFDRDTKEFIGFFTPKHVDPLIDRFMASAVEELCGLIPVTVPTLGLDGDDAVRAILPLDF